MVAASDNDHLIVIDKVTKNFGEKKAVNNLSLSVLKGEIFGFLGPNGAGKTTTIRLLLDILRPTFGSITLFKQPNTNVVETHRRIGYLAGEMVFEEDLSGKQYLQLANKLYGGNNGAEITRLAKLLDININTKIRNYSRGTRQKIGLICAMMHHPDLLILDEPTSGFDPLVQEIFAELIKKFQNDGGTVFMSSHVLSEVQQLCDRVTFINDGKTIGTSSIEDLMKTTSKRVRVIVPSSAVEHLKSTYHSLVGLKLLQSSNNTLTFSYKGDVKTLLKFFSNQSISDITIQEPELEEIFLKFYKKAVKSS